jgi:predicted TIM-barrel fold metal-dependent hydrolase
MSANRVCFSTFAAAILCAGLSAADARAQATDGATLVADRAAIDVHTHIASPYLTRFFAGGDLAPMGADDLVARLDEANVARAIILAGGYFGAPVGLNDDSNMAPENDFVASEVARFPDRLYGFCGINPLFSSAEDEIDRCLALPGMIGVKLHLEGSAVNLTDPRHAQSLAAVFDRIADHDAPVLMHVSDEYGGPLDSQRFAALAGIITSHPSVRIAHAHCAGNIDDDTIETWLRVRSSGYDAATSFVDVSACLTFHSDAPLAQRELTVWRLRKWGIDHVLFGSDYFAYGGETPRQALDILTRYPFTQAELDTILTNDGSAWLGH